MKSSNCTNNLEMTELISPEYLNGIRMQESCRMSLLIFYYINDLTN